MPARRRDRIDTGRARGISFTNGSCCSIPARLDVLDQLVARLAPGGWLVLEDFDTGEVRTTDRAGPDHELIVRMATAFNRLLAERGGA